MSASAGRARLAENQVTVFRDFATVGSDTFLEQHPSEDYPECLFPARGGFNPVYAAVRQLFRVAKLDEVGYGTADWKPRGTRALGCSRRWITSIAPSSRMSIWRNATELTVP